MRAVALALLISVPLFVIFGCKSEQDAKTEGAKQPLRIGIAIPSYVHAIAWIADDRGHFSEQKIKADVLVMGGSAATMRTLLADEIDIGLGGGDAVLKANRAGADLVVVATFVDRFYHRLITRKEIDSADSLREKKLGLPFLGGPQDMAAQVALKKLGLEYDKDVKIVSLGKEFNRMAALSNGEIDATTSQSPNPLLEELGFHVLVDLPSTPESFPYIVAAVKRSTLSSRRDAIVRGLAALCMATRYYKDSSNKDESLRIIKQTTLGSDTAGHASLRFETSGPSMIALPPVPNRQSFEKVAAMLQSPDKSFQVTDELFDPSLVDDLVKTGDCAP